MSDRPAIRLRGVVKRYGEITAVNGLDLDVPEGTCVGLLGPNGAGKSTTMRLLTAQAIADEGELEVLGFRLPEQSKQARALCGVTPQLDNLDTSLTVEQNLLVFTHLYRIGRHDRHAAIDDHSRVAYAEIHADERANTTAGFLERAIGFYRSVGVRVERVITDNAIVYRRSHAFRAVLEAHDITQKFIRPHCPWTNGKIERLNRTLATEWAYARAFTSNAERAASLPSWLDHYNLDRHHLGIRGIPIDRINNGRGQYI